MESETPVEDAEYPGVRWVLANYIILQLKDGQPMPRCQDLPAKAFGQLRGATRVFAVTHPWLARWHPDPNGIQIETLRAKLGKLKKQLMLDQNDVVFFDYLCLPQVGSGGKDDRTAEEKQRFRAALSGDLMGRVYLTARVIVIDEVPGNAESSTPYLNRGWCFFESMIASMNTFPRDLVWVTKEVKDQIASFRDMAAQFREDGDMQPLLDQFNQSLGSKFFVAPEDRQLVAALFLSLATSQRLVAAAVRGDVDGVEEALADGADPRSRNGQGRTALQAACANNRYKVVAEILRRTGPDVAAMRTMENESAVDLARESGARECQVLVRHKLGDPFPPLILLSVHGDVEGVKQFLVPPGPIGLSASTAPAGHGERATASGSAKAGAKAAAGAAAKQAPKAAAVPAKAPGRAPKALSGSGRSSPTLGKAKAAPPARGSAMRSAGRMVLEATPSSAGSAATAGAQAGEPPTLATPASPSTSRPCTPGTSAEAKLAPHCDVGEADDAGNTALHYAVSLAHSEIVEVLLLAKADAQASNEAEDTPGTIATRIGHKEILEMLRSAQ